MSDLRTFLAVAECRSFSKAGERLRLTQPAVTKRIKQLEIGLGTQLFDRMGKQVDLTHGGRLLLPRARNLLASLSDTEQLLQNLNELVCCHGSILPHWLQHVHTYFDLISIASRRTHTTPERESTHIFSLYLSGRRETSSRPRPTLVSYHI